MSGLMQFKENGGRAFRTALLIFFEFRNLPANTAAFSLNRSDILTLSILQNIQVQLPEGFYLNTHHRISEEILSEQGNQERAAHLYRLLEKDPEFKTPEALDAHIAKSICDEPQNQITQWRRYREEEIRETQRLEEEAFSHFPDKLQFWRDYNNVKGMEAFCVRMHAALMREIDAGKEPNDKEIKQIIHYGYNLEGVQRKIWKKKKYVDESLTAHLYGVLLLALKHGPQEGLDMDKVLKTAIVYDLHKAVLGEGKHTRKDEEHAIQVVLKDFKDSDQLLELWRDVKDQRTPEGRFISQLDSLETCMQAEAWRQERLLKNSSDLIKAAEPQMTFPSLQKDVGSLKALAQKSPRGVQI